MKLRIVVVSFLFLICGFIVFNMGCSDIQDETSIGPTDTVSSEAMNEDFQHVIRKLKNVHPTTVEGFSEIQKMIISDINEKIQQPMTKEKFFFMMNELFHSFHDAHTTQWLGFSEGIDLPLIWLRDGLYVKWDTDLLKRGDFIQSIGGRKVPQLFNQLNQILWTENDHLIRLEGPWMLIARPYLHHLGLIENDSVEVTYMRAGRDYSVQVPIIELNRPKKNDDPFISFFLEKDQNLAVLTLNSCRYNSEYRKTLRNFFKEIAANKIENVALDLRRNPGGDSRVIDEFIRYMDVDRLKTYGSLVRFSEEARTMTKVLRTGLVEFPRSEKTNKKIKQTELLFSGRIFVLTSPNTFSSANMFAAMIQDNRLGTIVGEPTGNQPSCYGHPLPFQMPRTEIAFKISHKQFFRPESTFDHIDAVYPDVEVYRKIDDVITGKDVQMEKIIELIKTEQDQGGYQTV